MENFRDNFQSHSKVLVAFSLGMVAGLVSRSNLLKRLRLVVRGAGLPSSRGVPRKMVIVARSDIPMSAGKIASQCAHAAVGCFHKAYETHPREVLPWLIAGQPKIVLRSGAGGDSALIQLNQQAKQNGLMVSLIQDAGKTEVRKGTYTALAIGPGPAPVIDQITGHLKTL